MFESKFYKKNEIKILIVDDDVLDRGLIKNCFSKSKILSSAKIFEAELAEELFSIVEKHDIDCVLLDFSLPDGNALEVIESLKRKNLLLPVVVITGLNSEKRTIEVMKAGASDYLSKSGLNKKNLEGVIVNALEKEQLRLLCFENEQKAIQNSKLTALGIMAGGIAHEINNPLAILLGQAEVYKLLKNKNLLTDKKIDGLFETIAKTVHRMAQTVEGLRLFCSELRNEDVDLVYANEIIDFVKSFSLAKLESRKIKYDIVDNTTSKIRCNPTQVAQVILNLINNSIDATELQEAPWVRLEASEDEKGIEISITDSGPKIPLSVQDNLFTPFFSTKRVDKGTGLGLSISKGVLGTFGGTLIFDKNFENTRFVLTLPVEKSEQLIKGAA